VFNNISSHSTSQSNDSAYPAQQQQTIQPDEMDCAIEDIGAAIDNQMRTLYESTANNMNNTDNIEDQLTQPMTMEEDNREANNFLLTHTSQQLIPSSVQSHDLAELGNAQFVSEYIDDIMSHLKSIERERIANPNYMSRQTDITAKMREILIDWLVEVHLKFRLTTETLYLTVNLIDRFLERRAVSRNKLQLVGCCAMLIASKYEEIYVPEVNDFVAIADRAYTRDNILNMETIMLSALSFNLTVPSAYRFGQRYFKLFGENNEMIRDLLFYLMELTLQDYRFLNYLPSQVAASAIYLALTSVYFSSGKQQWKNVWSSFQLTQTGYSNNDLQQCMTEISELANCTQAKYRAVRKKYAQKKFNSVATMEIKSPFA
jgi:hypothetical protein